MPIDSFAWTDWWAILLEGKNHKISFRKEENLGKKGENKLEKKDEVIVCGIEVYYMRHRSVLYAA